MNTNPRDVLDPFVNAGVFGTLEQELVALLEEMSAPLPAAATIAIAGASRAPRLGHVCVDLRRLQSLLRQELAEGDLETLPWPSSEDATHALERSELVRSPSSDRATPLVLSGSRLYLDRLFLDEQAVLRAVEERLGRVVQFSADEAAKTKSALKRIFAHPDYDPEPEQMCATAAALARDFAVLTGRPGSGKTTTVVRILAGWLERSVDLAQSGGQPSAERGLKIQLLAPTGKAAARLKESITEQLQHLDSPVRDLIPTEASTIHRALRPYPDRPGRFRHGPDSPLPVDAVVVDEASMIDVSLMARLFEALPQRARVLMVGDRDQLASVSAGAVLNDFCGPTRHPGYSRRFQATVKSLLSPEVARATVSRPTEEPPPEDEKTPHIRDAVIRLEKSHRFGMESELGELAAAVNAGAADRVMDLFRESMKTKRSALTFLSPAPDGSIPGGLKARIVRTFDYVANIPSAEEALEAVDTLRVLCAVRRGPSGVENTNSLISRALEKRLDVSPDTTYWPGQVVLINKNDHALHLYNGDVGLIRRGVGPRDAGVQSATHRRVACFPGSEGVRSLSPSRLPPHEVAFAMTIHKSQGSEFEEAVVVLPSEATPLLTRELIYTAITRAKKRVTLVGSEGVLRAAIASRVVRGSGLGDALWHEGDAPSVRDPVAATPDTGAPAEQGALFEPGVDSP